MFPQPCSIGNEVGRLRRSSASTEPVALLAKDGRVHSLNAAMATLLDKSAEQCAGRIFSRLFPKSQQKVADSLVNLGTTTPTVSMHVLEFPEDHGRRCHVG
ncbi:PAS domain-containing protein [Streptomyces sp900116325]|uniref:PAS domain-containing protein n=1 Tax=Streptomyces sp. 900116325 TaxID=3154295 RepID=UPI0033AFA3F0